jgi:glucose/arabinose dehydrogenase
VSLIQGNIVPRDQMKTATQFILALVFTLAACRAAPTTVRQETSPPDQTEVPTSTENASAPTAVAPAIHLAVPPEDKASTRLRVPNGFAVRLFASGLSTPRLMSVGPDGHLYVADSGASVVVRLADADGDGLADGREVVAEKLARPNNVSWSDNSMYVGEETRITRWTDKNGDGDFGDQGEREVVTDDIPTFGSHSSRTVHVGPDGMVYVAAGSTGNNNIEEDRRRATIMRFNPDGSIPEDNPFANDPETTRWPVWAEGLRNSVDFLFLPDGRLWANHNGSDMMGDDVPPEEIVIQVEKGKHYGWPYCYTAELGRVPPDAREVHDTRVDFERLTSCEEATPALFTDLAHQAPLGMARYAAEGASAFPSNFQGNLFVAYHGSWNSTVPRDCRVQMIVVRDGMPVDAQPFLTGFRDNDEQNCGAAWGRPAGVAVGPNGELFVSDDQNGNIYRVVYVGG